MVKQTSLLAYRQVEQDGTMGKQQKAIYGLLKESRGLTRSEISERTGIRMASVCGRVKELEKAGIIRVEGKKIDPTTGRVNERLVANYLN